MTLYVLFYEKNKGSNPSPYCCNYRINQNINKIIRNTKKHKRKLVANYYHHTNFNVVN